MFCQWTPLSWNSCHCTWIFDPYLLQFCRILKGIELAGRSVSTAWRPYWQLELDPEAERVQRLPQCISDPTDPIMATHAELCSVRWA